MLKNFNKKKILKIENVRENLITVIGEFLKCSCSILQILFYNIDIMYIVFFHETISLDFCNTVSFENFATM